MTTVTRNDFAQRFDNKNVALSNLNGLSNANAPPCERGCPQPDGQRHNHGERPQLRLPQRRPRRGSLPKGTYDVTRHLDSRSDRSMSVGGVGYSFAVSNKFDSRVGATRSLLRIHPDGGTPGTNGCIGIVGNADTQRQFRADMIAELRRNGGHYRLTVQ